MDSQLDKLARLLVRGNLIMEVSRVEWKHLLRARKEVGCSGQFRVRATGLRNEFHATKKVAWKVFDSCCDKFVTANYTGDFAVDV
jgi:3-methyladenine DNA glycosylase AlkD